MTHKDQCEPVNHSHNAAVKQRVWSKSSKTIKKQKTLTLKVAPSGLSHCEALQHSSTPASFGPLPKLETER